MKMKKQFFKNLKKQIMTYNTEFVKTVLEHLVTHWGIFFIELFFSPEYSGRIPYKTIFLVLFNQIFVSLPIFYFFPSFPNTPKDTFFLTENLYKIPITLFIYELLFFHVHFLFHKFLYNLHKIHHLYTHPISIGAFYSHPIEHALTNVLFLLISAKVAGLNSITFRVCHIYALFNTMIMAHGGYIFSSPTHTMHHMLNNCNYGVLGIFDRIYGTYK